MKTETIFTQAVGGPECLEWFTQLLEKIDAAFPGHEELDVKAWAREWFDHAFCGQPEPRVTTERQVAMLVEAVRTCVSEMLEEMQLEIAVVKKTMCDLEA